MTNPPPIVTCSSCYLTQGLFCIGCGHGLALNPGVLLAAQRVTFAGGRPRIQKRCACGKYSAVTAKKRGHKCT